MLKKRLIPVIILRDGLIVQSVQFKHTNVIHWKPVTAIDFFDRWAADEIIALDVSRNPAKREKFLEVIDGLSHKCFVPLTVGGWISSAEDVRQLLRLGADKVTINTEALRQPNLITDCAKTFGSQCIVVSIDVRRDENGIYEVYIDRGREKTDWNPINWAIEAQERGAGELLVNNIAHDGFRKGYDIELFQEISGSVEVPVIAMGGVFTWEHLVDGVQIAKVDAVAAANIFHYTEHSTKKAKNFMRNAGIDVR